MSYPAGPHGSPGYPPGQQPATQQFSAPTQQFGQPVDPSAPGGPSKLPVYLASAVAVLGLAVYLSSFFDLFTISASDFPGLGTISGSSFGLVLAIGLSLLAGLFAAASLLPKHAVSTTVVAVLSLTAFLLVIAEVINKPTGASVDVGLYLIIAFTLLQAIVAVAALLFESGVISPPKPRPKYEQHQQYGQYGGPGQYYGQPQHGGPQQRQGYPSTYPGGYSGGPSTGGYSGGQQSGSQSGQQSGPPTPPTGFPAYGQPPSSGSSATQGPSQPSSSSQSGPTPS